MIGMILALGAIVWALYQAAGGGREETAIPEGHRQAVEKAEAVEESVNAALQQRMGELEQQSE
jgi:hypothetical protein